MCLDAQKQGDESIARLLATGHQSELELGTSNGYQKERMKHPTKEVLFVSTPAHIIDLISLETTACMYY